MTRARSRRPARLAWLARFTGLAALASCGRADLLVLRGNWSHANGEYSRATVAYLAALEAAAAAAPYVQYDLGNVYAALGEPAAARDTLTRALDGQGNELLFRARFNLGALEYEQGRFEEAARSFAEALRHRPSDIDAKVNLELALHKVQSPTPRESAPAAERTLDRRTTEILDIARRKEAAAWKAAPAQGAAERRDDW